VNLQQLRYVAEVAQRNLNVSDAARALHTSQSGVSRQISLLEDELGLIIFVRHGKRLTAITRPGEEVCLRSPAHAARRVENSVRSATSTRVASRDG
jgi:LysR family cys regulon transcriptional activator